MTTDFWWAVVMELWGCGIWRIRGAVGLLLKIYQESLPLPLERWRPHKQSGLPTLNCGIQLLGSVEHESEIAFSADDNRVAILFNSLVTICDLCTWRIASHSIPGPKEEEVSALRRSPSKHVICAQLRDNGSDEISGLFKVWKVKGHIEGTFSLTSRSTNTRTSSWHLMAQPSSHWTCLHSTTPPQPSKSGAQPHESLASQFKPGLFHLSLHSYKSPPTLSPPSSSLQYFSLFPGQISPSRQGPWQGNNYENWLFQDLSTGLLVMPCNQLGRKVTSSSRPSSDT